MVPARQTGEDVLLYALAVVSVAVLLTGAVLIFGYTRAGRMVIDSTRLKLRDLSQRVSDATSGRGAIRLPEDDEGA